MPYATFNYIDAIKVLPKDVSLGSHPGDCTNDVNYLMNKPYIKKQLNAINPDRLKKELTDYGAWEESELSIHSDNLQRILWIACGDIKDNK